jgi:hypothetical protein
MIEWGEFFFSTSFGAKKHEIEKMSSKSMEYFMK